MTCAAEIIDYRALLREYRALLIDYRALLIQLRAFWRKQRAHWRDYAHTGSSRGGSDGRRAQYQPNNMRVCVALGLF